MRCADPLDGRTLDRGASGVRVCRTYRKILAERVIHLVSLVRMLTLFSSDVKTPFMKFRVILVVWFVPCTQHIFSTGCHFRCRFFVAWLLTDQQISAIQSCTNLP